MAISAWRSPARASRCASRAGRATAPTSRCLPRSRRTCALDLGPRGLGRRPRLRLARTAACCAAATSTTSWPRSCALARPRLKRHLAVRVATGSWPATCASRRCASLRASASCLSQPGGRRTRRRCARTPAGPSGPDLAGSDRLSASKRAELRGAISVKPGLARPLRTTAGGLLRIDETAIKAEERLDGAFLLRCSDPALSAEEIALGYKQLWQIQRAWRDMKQVIDLRPVYHRKEERIRAHVLLCWLALLLIRVAENACADSWPNLRASLSASSSATSQARPGASVNAPRSPLPSGPSSPSSSSQSQHGSRIWPRWQWPPDPQRPSSGIDTRRVRKSARFLPAKTARSVDYRASQLRNACQTYVFSGDPGFQHLASRHAALWSTAGQAHLVRAQPPSATFFSSGRCASGKTSMEATSCRPPCSSREPGHLRHQSPSRVARLCPGPPAAARSRLVANRVLRDRDQVDHHTRRHVLQVADEADQLGEARRRALGRAGKSPCRGFPAWRRGSRRRRAMPPEDPSPRALRISVAPRSSR